MPLVHECREPGCSTLTMGPFCVAHEACAQPAEHRAARLAAAAAAALLAGVAAAFLARLRVL